MYLTKKIGVNLLSELKKTEYKTFDKKKAIGVIALFALLIGGVGVVSWHYSWTMSHFHTLYLFDYLGFNDPQSQGIDIYDNVKIFVKRGDGSWMLAYEGHNQIQNDGRTQVARYIANDGYVASNATTNAWHWIAIGTGTGQGVADTTLATEFDRQQGTDAYPSAYNFTITYTWTAGSFSGQTIQECGLFNEAAAGVMFNYHDFTGITLQSTDSLQVQIEVQVGT